MLKNIKSKYILKLIFDLFGKSKGLLISHKNKYLNKELNIKVDDYKDAHDNILIKLKLSNNPEVYKEQKNYFICINLSNLSDDGYEIYFDDKKRDIHCQYVTKNDKVSSILIKIKPPINTLRNLFENCECIEEINVINCVRRNIIDTSFMFYGCSSLKRLDITRLRTDNVTNMNCMFFGCSSLREINASFLRTNNVTNMEGMFKCCNALENLNVSNFNTANVTNFCEMFYEDVSLNNLNVSNFVIINATYLDKMFYKCSSLANLKLFLLNFKPDSNRTDMFKGCIGYNMENAN